MTHRAAIELAARMGREHAFTSPRYRVEAWRYGLRRTRARMPTGRRAVVAREDRVLPEPSAGSVGFAHGVFRPPAVPSRRGGGFPSSRRRPRGRRLHADPGELERGGP